jgi:fructokinase
MLGPGGERDFMFYRDNAADMFLAGEELARDRIAGAAVLHVNTVMLLGRVSAAAQHEAIRLAGEAGRPVSVDLNFRRVLWADRAEMVAAGRAMIREAAILKLTDDELRDVAEGDSIADCVARLWHPRLRVCAVTKGAAGAELFTADRRLDCRGFRVDSIDTTGAGDAFAACLLSELIEMGFDLASEARLAAALQRACAAGALSTTRKGGMESMPDGAAIAALIEGRR